MNYEKTITYLYSLESLGIKPGLFRIKKVLSGLGEPENKFKSVLIAGTNGKGTTAHFIYSILKHSGYKTALYTSPHITKFEERIIINGKQITKRKMITYVKKIKTFLDNNDSFLTFFEFTTVLAFLYFSHESVDIAVLEVGMGGRFDAVNTVSPLVSVITQIDIDHSDWLGGTIEEIAFEKCGIIKDKGILISSAENEKAIEVIKDTCKEKNSRHFFINKDFLVKIKYTNSFKSSFDFLENDLLIKNIELPVIGDHFISNAALAISSVLKLRTKGYLINEDAIKFGLKEMNILGRFEILSKKPVIILDVAHNPGSLSALFKTIKTNFKDRNIYTIFGIMKDKNIKDSLGIITRFSNCIVLTKPKAERSADPNSVLRLIKQDQNTSVKIIESIEKAIRKTLKEIKEDDILCITGSFITISEAKMYFKTSHFML